LSVGATLDELTAQAEAGVRRKAWRERMVLGGLGAVVVVLSLAALAIGPVAIAPGAILSGLGEALAGRSVSALEGYEQTILGDIRLPRLLIGLLVGAGLGIAGAVLQGLFRNPLADPGLIGVTNGGALFAVAVIVLGSSGLGALTPYALPVAAFLGSLTATLLVYRLGRVAGRPDPATMLLAGIALNAIAAAGIGLLTYLSTDQELRMLTFWTMGSLGTTHWPGILPAAILTGLSLFVLLRLAPGLNAFSLGEADAAHLGVNVRGLTRAGVAFAALAVGTGVAVAGPIAFIGLCAPHLVRLLSGPDHRLVLPGAALMGAGLLLLADLLARTIVAPAELPIGLVTAAVGGPFFLWLLLHRQRRMSALSG